MERLQCVIQNNGECFINWYKFDLKIFRIDEIKYGISFRFVHVISWQTLDFLQADSKCDSKIRYWTQKWRHRSCGKARESQVLLVSPWRRFASFHTFISLSVRDSSSIRLWQFWSAFSNRLAQISVWWRLDKTVS
jgi:hypothetical protein